ncbi:hypothetical protein MEQU1_003403 [Malassezia equina]|uniref:Uncharacterized protein n=1 Tax=Malassezia equina TaxID=1381935 RepID=A0AAF0J562_9BASI|nr:hypothetical protein MEQU1_003403 [Malassezia equina]
MDRMRLLRRLARVPSTLRTFASQPGEMPAFTIPEEPIPIAQADEATAQASQAHTRAALAANAPQAAEQALERDVRRMRHHMLSDLAGLASTQTRDSSFRPFKLRTQPAAAHQLTLSHLLAATAQLGHAKQHVKRSYEPLLYGYRHGMAIIDVERATMPALRRAALVVRQIAENDGVILIVGTRPHLRAPIRAAVERLGANGFHVSTDRWMPGVLTNAPKLLSFATQYSVQRSRREEDRDQAAPNMTQLATLQYRPDLVIVLNPTKNENALREATQSNVPTMAIVDTNVDPRAVTYAIPANDDSPRVSELVLGVLSKAGEDGLRRRRAALEAWDKSQRRRRRSRPTDTAS